MKLFKPFAIAASMLLGTFSIAQAADMPMRAPPSVVAVAAPQEDFSGWYLRGDVGSGVVRSTTLDTVPSGTGWTSTGSTFNDTTSSHFIGAGVGYSWNSWLRTDVTLEYRGGSRTSGRISATNAGGCCTSTSNYNTSLSSVTGMANAYLDLGTWSGVTPFVGAGIGYTKNMMAPVAMNGIASCGACVSPTMGYINEGSKNSLAWALMAGLGYDVTRNTKLEIGYRYMNLGGFTSGSSWTDPCNCVNPTSVLAVGKMVSHDFHVGMRWQLAQPSGMVVGEPLIRKF